MYQDVLQTTFFPISNAIIDACHPYTLFEEKLISVLLADIKQAEYRNENLVMTLDVSYLRRLLYTDKQNIYPRLREACSNLKELPMALKAPGEKYEYHSIITDFSCRDGKLTVTFNLEMRDYLLDLRANFTMFELNDLLSFSSKYAIRLYKMLKRHAYAKKGRNQTSEFPYLISLPELRLMMGTVDSNLPDLKKILITKDIMNETVRDCITKCQEQKFVQWKDFKTYALKKAIFEIESKTSLRVRYDLSRGNKGKVEFLEFRIKFAK